MNKGRLLWMLVLADLLLAFASVGSEAFFGWTLPPGLKDYAEAHSSHSWFTGVGDVLQLFLIAVTCLIAFASWIALVCYWRYARELYLVACGLNLLMTLFAGASVEPSVAVVFSLLNAMVTGAIIALVYFSDLSRAFEPRKSSQAAPGAAPATSASRG